MAEWQSNPKLFAELNKPYASMAEADEHIKLFFEGMAALREQHKITNLLTVIACSVESEEGPQEFFSLHEFGDALKAETLAAYALGQTTQERRERLASLIAGKGTRRSK